MTVPPTKPLEGNQPVKAAEKVVSAMRDAVGPQIDVIVDCHARPSPAMGLKFGEALDPYGLYFLEEPCWPENVQDLGQINASVFTPIATGEWLTDLRQFRDLFAARGCDVCQSDITHCGGLTSARKIGALAEASQIALVPHNPQEPVSTAAALEFGFSQTGFVICESVDSDVLWREEVVQLAHPVDTETRTVRPHDRPGLGVDIDEGAIKKHPFDQGLKQRVFYDDGSVGDW